MKVFVLSYDLRNERDYDSICNRLNDLGAKRVLESLWTLKLDGKYTCVDVRDDLRRYMDSDDGIFVADMKSYAWAHVDNEPHKF